MFLVTQELMQSFKFEASLLLTDSGGYVKFKPNYTLEGGEGIRNLLKDPN